ncbi:MAG: alpha-L-rhamnosidase C-terminal domain-containing protein [Planctomycetota bacterium]
MKMFGSVEKYFYRDVAGLNLASPGYRTIVVRPRVVGDLASAKASIKSVRGLMAVDWKKSDRAFTKEVTVPANTTAEVSVPKIGLRDVEVTEGLTPVWRSGAYADGADGISGGEETGDAVTFDVGSDSYAFTLKGAAEADGGA